MQNKKYIVIKVDELQFYFIGEKNGPFLVQYFQVRHPLYCSAEIPINTVEPNKLIITVKQFKNAILALIKFLNKQEKLPFTVECGLRALVNNDKHTPVLEQALEKQIASFKFSFEDIENYSALQNRVFFTIPNQAGYRIKVKIVIAPSHRYKTYFTVNNNEGKVFSAVRWEKYKNVQSILKQVSFWIKNPTAENVELLKEVKTDIKRYMFNNRRCFSLLISVLNDHTRKIQ